MNPRLLETQRLVIGRIPVEKYGLVCPHRRIGTKIAKRRFLLT